MFCPTIHYFLVECTVKEKERKMCDGCTRLVVLYPSNASHHSKKQQHQQAIGSIKHGIKSGVSFLKVHFGKSYVWGWVQQADFLRPCLDTTFCSHFSQYNAATCYYVFRYFCSSSKVASHLLFWSPSFFLCFPPFIFPSPLSLIRPSLIFITFPLEKVGKVIMMVLCSIITIYLAL